MQLKQHIDNLAALKADLEQGKTAVHEVAVQRANGLMESLKQIALDAAHDEVNKLFPQPAAESAPEAPKKPARPAAA